MAIQAQIPTALCAIHNFIREQDFCEGRLPTSASMRLGYAGNNDYQQFVETSHDMPEFGSSDESPEEIEATAQRDGIAAQMWTNYQHILEERAGEAVDDYLSIADGYHDLDDLDNVV